jgi:hypothetical protein
MLVFGIGEMEAAFHCHGTTDDASDGLKPPMPSLPLRAYHKIRPPPWKVSVFASTGGYNIKKKLHFSPPSKNDSCHLHFNFQLEKQQININGKTVSLSNAVNGLTLAITAAFHMIV